MAQGRHGWAYNSNFAADGSDVPGRCPPHSLWPGRTRRCRVSARCARTLAIMSRNIPIERSLLSRLSMSHRKMSHVRNQLDNAVARRMSALPRWLPNWCAPANCRDVPILLQEWLMAYAADDDFGRCNDPFRLGASNDGTAQSRPRAFRSDTSIRRGRQASTTVKLCLKSFSHLSGAHQH